jgi:osmotically-inducible protein OsmY
MRTLWHSFPMHMFAAILVGLCACSDGSAEKVGRRIDQAAESAKEDIAQGSQTVLGQAVKAGIALKDVALAARVKSELRRDSALRECDISVKSRDGVIVLRGTVETQEDALRAVQIAREVRDVKSVESLLSVPPRSG